MHNILNYRSIERKIKKMSAHDIIMSMVEGLRNPRTKIDMDTYGEIREGVCFGCAATNAIMRIINADDDEVKSHITYRYIHKEDPLWPFECAIDYLREGRIEGYNYYAKLYDLAQIVPIPGKNLPYLNDTYTEEQLQEYVKLAEYQLIAKNQKK